MFAVLCFLRNIYEALKSKIFFYTMLFFLNRSRQIVGLTIYQSLRLRIDLKTTFMYSLYSIDCLEVQIYIMLPVMSSII